MLRRSIAFGVGLTLAGFGAAGCDSTPEKQALPQLQTKLLADVAYGNVLKQINTRQYTKDRLGACAVANLPTNKGSVVVTDPLFGEATSKSGNSTEKVRSFAFVVGLTTDRVELHMLGTQYNYSGGGEHQQGSDKNFYLVTKSGEHRTPRDQEVVPVSSVLAGELQAPETMNLLDTQTGKSVSTTFYRSETVTSIHDATELCNTVQQTGSNIGDQNRVQV